MLDTITLLAERRIQEALDNGELKDLPGEGKPLKLDDDRGVPEDLKMAYRVLKNAGFCPPEVELHKEIRVTEDLLATLEDEKEKLKALKRLSLLRLKMDMTGRSFNVEADKAYHAKVVEKLERKDRDRDRK